MHFALFIVNKNGSLVYNKVAFKMLIFLGYIKQTKIFYEWYDKTCFYFSFYACYFILNYSCNHLFFSLIAILKNIQDAKSSGFLSNTLLDGINEIVTDTFKL